ncbi:hypothetical protein EDEG_02032 [Edhazardia aedis USNM 41457]|uniref:Uncharacterized protein n=1 Tax=Edhazardia aedis (strain USNM 41457) TaxID=1003232 RepID=J9DM21_EDHAE|nr:hypothetical protein EDEG_02032 [Edhazardia aedis USNM 41457]|eukprot:EJW03635.1 hypothetical protein EDEG_02032 [Edhazardia aedis USNM 41457]
MKIQVKKIKKILICEENNIYAFKLDHKFKKNILNSVFLYTLITNTKNEQHRYHLERKKINNFLCELMITGDTNIIAYLELKKSLCHILYFRFILGHSVPQPGFYIKIQILSN